MTIRRKKRKENGVLIFAQQIGISDCMGFVKKHITRQSTNFSAITWSARGANEIGWNMAQYTIFLSTTAFLAAHHCDSRAEKGVDRLMRSVC